MPRKERTGRTSFEKVQKTQKLTRKDAMKIRACFAELPHLAGFNTLLAGVYGVTPDTVGRILRNELHCE